MKLFFQGLQQQLSQRKHGTPSRNPTKSWQKSRQENWKCWEETDMQHSCVTICEDCAIFTERMGDWLPKLRKVQSELSGGWLTTKTVQCISEQGLLRNETAQSTISVNSDMQTKKLHCANSRANKELPLRIAQCKTRGQC